MQTRRLWIIAGMVLLASSLGAIQINENTIFRFKFGDKLLEKTCPRAALYTSEQLKDFVENHVEIDDSEYCEKVFGKRKYCQNNEVLVVLDTTLQNFETIQALEIKKAQKNLESFFALSDGTQNVSNLSADQLIFQINLANFLNNQNLLQRCAKEFVTRASSGAELINFGKGLIRKAIKNIPDDVLEYVLKKQMFDRAEYTISIKGKNRQLFLTPDNRIGIVTDNGIELKEYGPRSELPSQTIKLKDKPKKALIVPGNSLGDYWIAVIPKVDGFILLLDPKTGKKDRLDNPKPKNKMITKFFEREEEEEEKEEKINDIALGKGNIILSVSNDLGIAWNPQTKKIVNQFRGGNNILKLPDSNIVVTVGSFLEILDPRKNWMYYDNKASSVVTLLSDGRIVYGCNADDTIKIWNYQKNKNVRIWDEKLGHILPGHKNQDLIYLSAAPDNRLISIIQDKKKTRTRLDLWDTKNYRVITSKRTLLPHIPQLLPTGDVRLGTYNLINPYDGKTDSIVKWTKDNPFSSLFLPNGNQAFAFENQIEINPLNLYKHLSFEQAITLAGLQVLHVTTGNPFSVESNKEISAIINQLSPKMVKALVMLGWIDVSPTFIKGLKLKADIPKPKTMNDVYHQVKIFIEKAKKTNTEQKIELEKTFRKYMLEQAPYAKGWEKRAMEEKLMDLLREFSELIKRKD